MARLQTATHGGGTSTYEYGGASPLAAAITQPSGVRTTFGYDALNRLTGITNRKADLTLLSSNVYTYDSGGRRTSDASVGGLAPPAAASQQTTSEFDPVNALLSSVDPAHTYAYDADGNQTRGRAPGGQAFTAHMTQRTTRPRSSITEGGHLRRNEYQYDGDGWLVRIVERTDGAVTRERRFVRGPRLFLQERDAANTVAAELVWNPAKPGGIGGLLKRRSGGTDYTFLNDAAGNVTAVVNAAQAIVASYRYDPFGRVESESGTLAQDFRFQSKFLDPRSGLSYFGFRWDAPGDGRWLTRDPLRERAGLNLYDYVGNDPINRIDAWGLQAGPAPSSGYWARYDDSAGVCGDFSSRKQDPWSWKFVAGKTWAWIQAFIGTDKSDGTHLSEPGNSGANGVRADSGGSDGSEGGPNAVAGVRG